MRDVATAAAPTYFEPAVVGEPAMDDAGAENIANLRRRALGLIDAERPKLDAICRLLSA